MSPSRLIPCLVVLLAGITAASVCRAGTRIVELRFEKGRFEPSRLVVPAGQAFSIKISNASKETIEFESFKLNREKPVQAGQTATVQIPALSAGSYDFYDDFHDSVPQGSIVAK